MPSLTINGTSLFYEVHGHGIPLVFVHSHGLSHHTFFPQIHYFRKSYKVVLVDLRGNGNSGKLNVAYDEILRTQSADLKCLLDALGIPKAVFIGAADGGVLVQKFSHLYPDRVSAIILTDSYSKNAVKGPLGKLLFALQIASWLTYYLPGEMLLRSLKLTYYEWDIAYNTIRYEILHMRPTALFKQRLALRNIDYRLFIQNIKVPVLCLAGDAYTAGVRQMRETAGLIPHAKLVVIKDSFKPSNLCQPMQFNKIVMGFLEENRKWIDPDVSEQKAE